MQVFHIQCTSFTQHHKKYFNKNPKIRFLPNAHIGNQRFLSLERFLIHFVHKPLSIQGSVSLFQSKVFRQWLTILKFARLSVSTSNAVIQIPMATSRVIFQTDRWLCTFWTRRQGENLSQWGSTADVQVELTRSKVLCSYSPCWGRTVKLLLIGYWWKTGCVRMERCLGLQSLCETPKYREQTVSLKAPHLGAGRTF